MKILLVGAAGFIGARLARRFLAAGDQVRACGRDVAKLRARLPGAEAMALDLNGEDLAERLASLKGVDVAINAAGIIAERAGNRMEQVHAAGPRALFEACHRAGVAQVIQISALGADPAGTTRYFRTKGRADAALAALDPRRQRMLWTVVRPSVVIGRGAASSALFAAQAAFPLMPRLGEGRWRLQPIHVSDLVEMIFALTRDRASAPAWIEATGPEPMTTDELTGLFRRWLGLPGGRFVTVPEWALRWAGRVGDWMPLGPLDSEALAMLRAGNVRAGPPSPGEVGVGAPLAQAMAREPAARADLWAARLTPLRAPLRWTLGLFWILSGLLPLAAAEAGREGYALLARMGVEGGWAALLLQGSAAVDILLGLMLLRPFHPRLAGGAQILLTLVYSALIAVWLPEFLVHPFGPLTKNLPLVAATAVMMVLEE